MHDLIESRTIYIRDQEACSEIARFRNISIEKTAEAHAHYSEISKRIDHLGEKYAAVSIDVSSIPNLFGVELDYEIMHWLFRLEFEPKVDAMLDLLNSLKEIAEENSQPAFQRSRLVWALHLVQSHDQDGIGFLSRKLKEEILPPLAKTIELGTCMEDIYTQTTFDPEDLVDEANGREVPQVSIHSSESSPSLNPSI
ncbi:unnamed protein product [Clonostachys rosea f. rosea IK726]|uniref:Uncharacterized protein n=1 Tax=Clonostachys rosea f. rosea IK726 TaxID=1349383 RepID=A0ACA9UR53_BIOOC|nr:unnamed protein product [Clonostachys rosea f. rosea IK726]